MDRHPWRFATLCTLGLIGLSMGWTCGLGAYLHGPHRWWIPGDVWIPVPAAHFIVNGAFPYQYEVERGFVYPPGLAVVLAPVALVGELLRLSESSTGILVPRPQLWLVLGPYGTGLALLPLVALRRLLVLPPSVGAPAVQAAVAAVALIPAAVVWGHYEELLVIGFLLLAARLVMSGRPVPASLAVGAAIFCKQTALLAAPVILFRTPGGPVRRRCLFLALGLPSLLTAVCLVFDWHDAAHALFGAQSFPSLGRTQPWVDRAAPALSATPLRAAAVLAATGLGYALRRRAEAATILAALAATAFLRLAVEPVLFAYYLAPPATFTIAAMAMAGRAWRWSALVAAGAGLLFLVHGPPLAWWTVFAVVTVVLAEGPASILLEQRRKSGQTGKTVPRLSQFAQGADRHP